LVISMRVRLLSLVVSLALVSAAAKAQSAHWDPPGGTLPVGQGAALQLVFEDCEAKDTPAPPRVDGLALEYSGQSSSMSWINGTYSHSVMYNFAALLSKNANIEIPAFDVETTKGRVRVAAARFSPTGATVGSTGQALDTAAKSSLEALPDTVWAGEVFDLTYRIEVARSYYPDFGHGAFEWKPEPLVAEDWSQPVAFTSSSLSEPQTGLTYRTRAFVPKPGTVVLSPARQIVNLSIGMSGLGFFQQRQFQQFSITSSAPTIEVRPLPPAPLEFTGAVGSFTLASKVVPTTVPVGEPVTWTVELKGRGNWPEIPGLPARDVSKAFQVVQPKPKRTPVPNKLFDSTLSEDVVLVPTEPGTYDLPPASFTYFDPKEGVYRTLTAPGARITVTTPAATQGPSSAAGPQPDQGSSAPPAIRVPASPPPPPSGLPRDLLPDSGISQRPLPAWLLASLLLAPFILFIFLWLWHALRRAKRTDPQRARREAHSRLTATLARIRADGAAGKSITQLLASWLQDAAVLWGVERAAPSAQDLAGSGLETLWAEAERVLYGPDTLLPHDWPDRAAAALAAKPAPRFAKRQVFLPRNLLPWFFALIILGGAVGSPAPARANEGGAAYRRGDFPASEEAWRDAVSREPGNWAARHNLSLALAQQNRWDEAAAQAAAAFVQQPDNPAVRWQFALACDKAGFSPTALAAFLQPTLLERLAQHASPAGWQRTLAAAAWVAAAVLGFLLTRRYQAGARLRRWEVPAALTVLTLSALVAGAAILGWRAYGTAASTEAVVTWRDATLSSIPTEADTSQKTVPLPAGSVALADKSFLGWIRLSFDNGQTGWVRKEEAVGLWN
jgi:hypothetical protein